MVDIAELKIISNLNVALWSQVDECHRCPLVKQMQVSPVNVSSFFFNTKYKNIFEVRFIDNQVPICSTDYQSFSDEGRYLMNISSDRLNDSCHIYTVSPGRNNIWPWICYFCLAIIFSIFYVIYKFVRKQFCNVTDLETEDESDWKAPSRNRLASVDALRGLTILLMIFVNSGGGGYYLTGHAPWYGFTIADFVFPCFVFILGISVAISVNVQFGRLESGSYLPLIGRIIKRSILLFAIGIMLNSMSQGDLSNLRIPGVLQRLAITYLVVALVYLFTLITAKNYLKVGEQNPYIFTFKEKLKIYSLQCFTMITLLLTYLCFTFCWNYDENCPKGYQGPGGLEENAHHFNCTGGAANVIDRIILGENHLYKHSTSKDVYRNRINFDPEGILGAGNSILLAFVGLSAGMILRRYKNFTIISLQFIPRIMILCAVCLILSASGWIPISKNLWSLSFVCLSGAISLLLLLILNYLIDYKMVWLKGKPFNYPGMNSLLIYIGSEVLHKMFPFYYVVDESSHYLLLMRSLLTTFLWLLVSYQLARKKIFIKL